MLGLVQHKNVDVDYWGVESGLVLTHLTIEHIKSRMNISDYYVFAFVRNPYNRIISEYNWRMRNRKAFEDPTGRRMRFTKYCELLYSKWDGLMNDSDMTNVKITNIQHIRPQSDYVDDDVEIYRHEDFKNECLRIQERLGIDVAIPRRNMAKYNTKHTDRTIEKTNELYAEDFKTFGYDRINNIK